MDKIQSGSFKDKDTTWLQDIVVYQYKQKKLKGVKYQHEIRGTLGTDISKEMATKSIKSCRIKGDIHQIIYHHMNQDAKEQSMDEFVTSTNNRKLHFTVIVSLTKLDMIIDSKNGNNYNGKNTQRG